MDANLNKVQQALSMIHPEPERGRGKKDEATKGAETAGSSYRRLAVAREIVRHAPDLAQQVVSASRFFSRASTAAACTLKPPDMRSSRQDVMARNCVTNAGLTPALLHAA
jgi:hypothetical protein